MTPDAPTMTFVDLDEATVGIATYGSGRPILLLHGGAGPQSMIPFAELLSARGDVSVLLPTHPGFGGTSRPETLSGIPRLAALYRDLLDHLDLHDVLVIGNSIGGWTAAEIGLLHTPRVIGLVLIDPVGIEVPGHPIADFYALTMDEVFDRSFHNPEPFRVDPTTLPPQAQAIAAGNRAALNAYAGTAMCDPTLIEKLSAVKTSTLVLWGSADRIADPDYGRAYAAAIPAARFTVLPATGHSPQLETPAQTLDAVAESFLGDH
ncbi:MAG: alpha/beta hydrolase [Mycobacterium sp.]